MGLQSIVNAYIRLFRQLAQAELNWFNTQPSFTTAIETAAFAKNREGKRYNHQRRLGKDTLNKAHRALLNKKSAIERCTNFDELYQLINVVVRPIKGIGELYVYDTALRIGAKLRLSPEKVYLHAGTREGAKELGLDIRLHAIEMRDLPKELHNLEPHEIEDVLCIFKSKFKQVNVYHIEKFIATRSRCC